jgi:phosphoglycerate dehydrogenase-like enzyme
VDEPALALALASHTIAGAALDVFAKEPLPSEHIFRNTPNLLLSPHQCSWAYETGAAVSNAAAEGIIELSQGRRPRWVVDPGVYTSRKLRAEMIS